MLSITRLFGVRHCGRRERPSRPGRPVSAQHSPDDKRFWFRWRSIIGAATTKFSEPKIVASGGGVAYHELDDLWGLLCDRGRSARQRDRGEPRGGDWIVTSDEQRYTNSRRGRGLVKVGRPPQA